MGSLLLVLKNGANEGLAFRSLSVGHTEGAEVRATPLTLPSTQNEHLPFLQACLLQHNLPAPQFLHL